MSLSILLSVLSIIIIGIGYSIKNIKPNPVFGIRLKWALEDETNWKKTHQFSGILWMICGLFGLFCAYIQSMALFNLMILLAILCSGVDSILQGDVLPGIISLIIGLGIIAFLLKFVKGKI